MIYIVQQFFKTISKLLFQYWILIKVIEFYILEKILKIYDIHIDDIFIESLKNNILNK